MVVGVEVDVDVAARDVVDVTTSVDAVSDTGGAIFDQ